MNAAENILEISGLSKQYQNFRLNNISFVVPKGSIMGLIGSNGAGKTTTIKLILDLIHRETGEIQIMGEENTKVELKQEIGVVFDENNFPETLTIFQVGKIMSSIYQNWNQEQFHQYCVRFALPGKKIIKEFSRGMKMKLNLAVALSHHAKLLILDEPTSGLDPIVRNEILDIFQEFIAEEERAILLSSHITTDLEKIADYITLIDQGELIFSKNKDDLIYQYGMMKGKKDDISKIDSNDYVSIRTNQYGFEALVKDKEKAQKKYPDCVFDPASLEDIMLFSVQKK